MPLPSALPHSLPDGEVARREDRVVTSWTGRSLRWVESPAGQYAALALLTVLAAGLRFYKLGEWSFWIDEIFTLVRVDAHVNLSTILRTWWHPSPPGRW